MLKKFSFLCVSFFLFVLTNSISAQPSSELSTWKIDDVLKQESAGSFDISPDGKQLVWVKTRPDKKSDGRISDLFLSEIDGSKEVHLTRGKVSDRSPKWSPNGKLIAFTSVRGEGKDKQNQIWLINPNGGEPWQLTKLKKGVNSFKWRSADEIVFSAREDSYQFEDALKEKKDDAIVVGDQEHFLPVRLFSISLKSKKVKRISENSGKVGEFEISQDGKWIVTSEAQNIHYPYDNKIPPRQFLYNIEQATREEIFTNTRAGGFVWDSASAGFYCSVPESSVPGDDYVSVSVLRYFEIDTKTVREVPLEWEWKLGSGYFNTAEGLLVSLANGAVYEYSLYKKNGVSWTKQDFEYENEKNIRINGIGEDQKTVVFTYSTASAPPVVKSGKLSGGTLEGTKKVISLNKWTEKKHLAKSEVISWRGARGDLVEGVLFYPVNYEEGKKYPLMCSIHGGPTGVDRDAFREAWSTYPNLLSGKGAFVLKVNYHGSGNYGLKWMESIKGNYYDLEVPDILNGVDHLIELGMVDPEKLGIMGWSNGAILAIQCVIETDRFKVAAPGAGDVNWTSDYGNCAFGAGFDNAYFGSPPWENPEYYIKKSPLFQMEKVKTPTIIFFGTKDTNVPTEQGWEHYRALQQIGKAPVRFILFPGEPHGLRKLSHQRRKMEEEIAWLDKYLFNTFIETNEALKEGSPLSLALKLESVEKSGVLIGQLFDDKLIPEVTKFKKLTVGRFEVTRAQFAEFDSEFKFPRGTENYPVTGISFENAKKYCEWLSELTDSSYRLPKMSEMNELLKNAAGNSKNENNLDYWSGYSINPDDAAALKEKLKKMSPETLLKPVGSFKPIGKKPVWDLGGNAAEWCVTKDGKGAVLGNSAVSPIDSKGEYQVPESAFVGFRVVRE